MRRGTLAAVGAGLALAGGLAAGASVARPAAEAPPPTARVASAAERRDRNIEFFRARVARDSFAARDHAELARLYLQRARESGDGADLARAEASARRSLELRTGRNATAFFVLASALLAQHRFAEALQVAERLAALEPGSVSARALLAEAQLELGRYDEAARGFGALALHRRSLVVAPRLARWEEVRGRPLEARRLLRDARDAAERAYGVPPEQRAWLQLRLGELALRHGRLGEAARELRRGLGIAPDDYRLLGALARVAAARGRWAEAAETAERAIARAVEPATLGLAGDAYAALGDSGRAAEYYRATEVAALAQPGPLHRAWSLHLLDRDREVADVLARAREEIGTRRDVWGYDLLGWALHKAGRHGEAREAVRRALAPGTRDAALFFHAGMIARAAGDRAGARRHLEAALATNPYWHPTQPAAARAALDSLRRDR